MRTPRMNKTFISAAAALALSGSVYAATWTVTDLGELADYNCGDTANLSLRDAIGCASAGDTIVFSSGGTIPVTSNGGGAFDINKSVTIIGPGQESLNFAPDPSYGIFTVPVGVTATISSMTLNGVSGSSAAVDNQGTLTLTDCNISANKANSSSTGAVVRNSGTLTINSSKVYDNTCLDGVGMCYNGVALSNNSGSMSINSSVIEKNFGSQYGSAIYVYGGQVSVNDSVIRDNNATNSGGAVYVYTADMVIQDSNITGNRATSGGSGGGAINNVSATLSISDSILSDNYAYSYGGAINSNGGQGSTVIVRSTLSKNKTSFVEGGDGGAVYVSDSDLNISESTITGNGALWGGGIAMNSGGAGATNIEIVNSTISGNFANNYGGGISADNTYGNTLNVNITHTTIADNNATYGGGLYGYDSSINIKSTIISDSNTSDCVTSTAINSYGYNIVEDNSSCAGFSEVSGDQSLDPILLPLADNGGPTWTHALDPLSPARGAGDPTMMDISGNYVATDQRGLPRFTPPAIGAYEPQAALITPSVSSYNFGTVNVGESAGEYTITVTNDGESAMTIDNIYLYNGTYEFTWNDYCGSTPIQPGASCTIGVNFSPSYPQPYSDILVIESTGSSVYAQVGLIGTGVDSSMSYEEIYFDEPITVAEYNAETALDPSLFVDMNLFELRMEYDGPDTGMIDVVSGSPMYLNFYDFNLSTLSYNILKEKNPFTVGSDYVMSFKNASNQEMFKVKYVGSQPASDLNATLFGPNGKAYEFAYVQLLDEYRLEDIQYDYDNGTEVPYTSITDFLADHNDTDSYFMQKRGSYGIGLVFDYTAGATSGVLKETEYGTIVNSNAGTWAITTVASEVVGGYNGTALVVSPTDTTSYYDDEFWAMDSGYLHEGYAQLADKGFRFFWFDQAAHNDFVTSLGGVLAGSDLTGSITLPSSYSTNVTVTVFIDIPGNDDWISNQFTLSPGQTQTFTLTVPDGTEQYRVGYYIEDSVTGLVQKGYFSGLGTTAYEDEAMIYSSAIVPTVALTVLEGQTISGTVTLPAAADDNETRLDIVASVDVLGASALFRHQISADVQFVQGYSTATYTLTIPEEDKSDKYYIAYDFFDGDEYIRQGYYATAATTPYFSDATAVDTSGGDVSGINIDVMNGVAITGTATVSATSSLPTFLLVRAMRDDGYEVFGGTEIPAGATSVSYSVDVPDTATAHTYKLGYYVLKEDSPNIVDNTVIGYWNTSGTVTNRSEAGEFTVSGSDVENKNFTVPNTAVQSVAVSTGWNLLSLPSKAEFGLFDMILHFGFRQDSIVCLAKYGTHGWSYYVVNRNDDLDNLISGDVKGPDEETVKRFYSLNSGEGFWLLSYKSFTLPFAMANDTDYADEVPDLKTGWNLIGVNKDMSAEELVNLYAAQGKTTIESIWTYKGGVWKVYIPDAALDTLVSDTIQRMTNVTRFDGIWINLKGEE